MDGNRWMASGLTETKSLIFVEYFNLNIVSAYTMNWKEGWKHVHCVMFENSFTYHIQKSRELQIAEKAVWHTRKSYCLRAHTHTTHQSSNSTMVVFKTEFLFYLQFGMRTPTHYNPARSGRSWCARLKHKERFLSNSLIPWFHEGNPWRMFYKRQISSHRFRPTLPNTRLTFRCVPVDERVHQRPAFAIVSSSKLEPVSFQGTHHLTFPGNSHGECPLVVLWDQWVQWSKTWSPRMEEHEELQA